MKPHPVEVVVIRDLALRRPAEPPPTTLVDPLDLFAQPFQHDVAALVASAFSPVRLRVLLALARGETVAVTALAQRVGEDRDKISGHLRPLRLTDLVRERHCGKEHHYTADPDRIHLTRDPTGGFALDLLARARGRVMLTLRVLGEDAPSPFATDGARIDTDQEGKTVSRPEPVEE
jgi:DNA-binding transcriptional ArsR family regulator